MKKVAVERDLSRIGDYLKSEGYNVEQLDTTMKYNTSILNGFDAVVLSGVSDDMMGMQDTLTSTPIINADGMTVEQIKSEIEKKSIK